MNLSDYPPQEPLSDFGQRYHALCLARSNGIQGEEHAYGREHPCQSLMVFPAAEPSGACLLFMFGGGWTNGYKEQMAFVAPGLNKRGVTVVSVGYRLAPEFVFPDLIADIRSAFGWVFRHAETYAIDVRQIHLGGHSAGGHLASIASSSLQWLSTIAPEARIAGCLPISATFDFTPGNGLSMRPRFLGPKESQWDVPASPLFNMQDTRVPFLVAYGQSDFPHLIDQAAKFAMVRRHFGGVVEVLEIPGADHLTAATDGASPDGPWPEIAARFMTACRRSDFPA